MTLTIGPKFKFEEAGAEGGDGGGGAPVDSPPAEAAPVDAAPAEIVFPENWKDGLPEEIRMDPSLGVVADIPNLAKSFVNAQKQIGRDRVVIPDKHATDEDWRGVYQKLGLPAEIDKYEIQNPEGAEFDDGVVTNLKKAAFEQGILPKQFQGLLNVFAEQNKQVIDDYDKQVQAETDKRLNGLKHEWGTKFQQNAALVQAIVEEAATKLNMADEVRSFMNNAMVDGVQLGNHPTFMKMLNFFTQFMSEDQLPATGMQPGGQTRKEVQSKINEIMGNAEHPYHNQSHPSHKNAVEEMQRMFKQLHPGQNEAEGSQIFQTSY